MSHGTDLIATIKSHVIDTMRLLPECQSGTGTGVGYRAIEMAADLDLDLRAHNRYLTWSVLVALAQDGAAEVVPGAERRRRYRLV